MNKNEISKFGALFKGAGDGVEFGETDTHYWHGMIGHLSYEEAVTAAAVHARTSTFPLKPAHVLDIARKAANDRVERRSVDPEFRADRDAERDDRLAELVGGDRRVLGETRRGRGEPATSQSRAAALATIKSLGSTSRRGDAEAIAALGPLSTLDTYKILDAYPDWPRNRAAKALHHARCVEQGIQPPAPFTAERRRLRPTPTPGSKLVQADARNSALHHLDRIGLDALFTDDPSAGRRAA